MQDFVGFILPPFIDMINKHIQNATARFWAAIVISLAVATCLNLDKLNNFQDLLGSTALVFAEAQIVYKTYWEGSKLRSKTFEIKG